MIDGIGDLRAQKAALGRLRGIVEGLIAACGDLEVVAQSMAGQGCGVRIGIAEGSVEMRVALPAEVWSELQALVSAEAERVDPGPLVLEDGDAAACDWPAHVAGLDYPPGWSRADDIRLVEGLCGGSKLADLAMVMEEPAAALQARYALLMRGVTGCDARLLAALRDAG